jgi:hypothetical protein
MSILTTTAAKNAMLGALRTALEAENATPDGLYLYLFNGAVPETADEALDMATEHTQLVQYAADDPAEEAGVEPLEFDAPAGGVLSKDATQTWQGVAAFDGANDGEATLPATFFRLCAGTDDGRGAGDATTYRLQGTVGPTVGADLLMPNTTITNGGTETRGLSVAQFNVFG